MIFEDATAQAEAIRHREMSARELVRDYIDRIDRLDHELKSFVALDADRALADAATADEAVVASPDDLAPFHGVSLSIKDVTDMAGVVTTHSCKLLKENVASNDSLIVDRFRAAGFALLGKTNIPEFCTTMTTSELNGTCRNPWDLSRTPGGSSGGAAAALAAGLCAASHGTDGAGSVRGPAGFCGLVGVLPTRGLLGFPPLEGNPYPGTSSDGVLTRSVRDCAAILASMIDPGPAGRWAPEPSVPFSDAVESEPKPLRIAVTSDPFFGVLDAETEAAISRVGTLLEDLGHRVDERAPDWMAILAHAAGPMSVPGSAGLVSLDDINHIEPRNRPFLEREAALSVADHARWVDELRVGRAKFLEFWEDVDLLVSPTCGRVAPPLTWATWDQSPEDHMAMFMEFPNFAQPFNLSGQPGISIPLEWSADGLPIGIHLAGRPLEESILFSLAAQLERAQPWSERRPPAPFGTD
ncbi:MAG: amidase [bacterium]|nr:amidase [bacterium]